MRLATAPVLLIENDPHVSIGGFVGVRNFAGREINNVPTFGVCDMANNGELTMAPESMYL